MADKIPFHKPSFSQKELIYLEQALSSGKISGDGDFTKACHQHLQKVLGAKALLTHSCTAALEMMPLLLDLKPGDEVIMPSFTFVSTANAFALRGVIPVFVDIRPDTMNIDEKKIEAAITSRTKGICAVHYAGVACEMNQLLSLSRLKQIPVLEDAAQGVGSFYRKKPLGTFGLLGALSFHETKNVISGEGGALIINDSLLGNRAEIIREKGTDRSQFIRGQVDKYTWRDLGSSYLPSELIAAVLLAQLEKTDELNKKRLKAWNQYHKNLQQLETEEKIRRPVIPSECEHNAHMYYILTRDLSERTRLTESLKNHGITAAFHYIPLHSSPAGQKYCQVSGKMTNTEFVSERLLRLPMFSDLQKVDQITEVISQFYSVTST